MCVIENEKDNINVFCTKLKINVSHTLKYNYIFNLYYWTILMYKHARFYL